jgi:hypothetical protein
MKQFSINLLIVLMMGFIFWGCSDQQPLEPASGDQSLLKGPSDGNGNKLVFQWDYYDISPCSNGEDLTLHDVGWAQFKWFGPPNNKNVELGIFHVVLTFSNSAGDEFVYRDVGPDRVYVEGDEIFVAVSGRSSASGNPDRDEINIGHMVLNMTTGEVVLLAGNNMGNLYELACETLN